MLFDMLVAIDKNIMRNNVIYSSRVLLKRKAN